MAEVNRPHRRARRSLFNG